MSPAAWPVMSREWKLRTEKSRAGSERRSVILLSARHFRAASRGGLSGDEGRLQLRDGAGCCPAPPRTGNSGPGQDERGRSRRRGSSRCLRRPVSHLGWAGYPENKSSQSSIRHHRAPPSARCWKHHTSRWGGAAHPRLVILPSSEGGGGGGRKGSGYHVSIRFFRRDFGAGVHMHAIALRQF
jgi:hypothetical protein